MQTDGPDVGVEIDRPINTERGVLLARYHEAGESEEAKGRTLRRFRPSGGRRQIPSAHQEAEAARRCQDESEGRIHDHELSDLGRLSKKYSDPVSANWVSVSESTTLAVIVGGV